MVEVSGKYGLPEYVVVILPRSTPALGKYLSEWSTTLNALNPIFLQQSEVIDLSELNINSVCLYFVLLMYLRYIILNRTQVVSSFLLGGILVEEFSQLL